MGEKIQHKLIISSEFANKRLDHVLTQLLPQYSRTQLQNWIVTGKILLNGKSTKANTKVKTDQEITLEVTIEPNEDWLAQAIPLDVIYEDSDVLVINKPANLVVHPGAGNLNGTLLNALLNHCQALRSLPRAGIVHRLDKDTSGLLVIAKNSEAVKHLQQQIKVHQMVREYKALVQGVIISGGHIATKIGRHPRERKRMAVIASGKEALTHYRVAQRFRGHTLLDVKLETGRTHQIRVHFAHIGHPIVGDQVYTGRLRIPKGMPTDIAEVLRSFKRQALHAAALTLTHPRTNKLMRFEAKMPKDMQALLANLKQDQEHHS